MENATAAPHFPFALKKEEPLRQMTEQPRFLLFSATDRSHALERLLALPIYEVPIAAREQQIEVERRPRAQRLLVKAARKPQPPFTLRFYSDRLVAENENERHVFPQALLRLQLMPDALVIKAPRAHYTLPFSHIEDAAGLQAFLRPAPVVNESVNLSATPDSVSKEQE
jgi:hypothetical protein